MSSTKTAFCIGAFALAIAATGNAIEPRLGDAPVASPTSHTLTLDAVRASSAQLTGRLIAPYLPPQDRNE
ncbi:hypothetical protein [Aquisalinus flavus]|nr:hypothetical protein [Aquisalinus flavus]UNE48916.1 hypothetical protein FF099_13080 [Aquisalinus flavus]